MRLLDTGFPICGGFILVYGDWVLYGVARHYDLILWMPREDAASLVGAVGMLRYDPGFDDKILPVYM